MRKYNPCHDAMVSNYREKAEKLGLKTDYLSNEELFRIIETWADLSTPEETEHAVIDDIMFKRKR